MRIYCSIMQPISQEPDIRHTISRNAAVTMLVSIIYLFSRLILPPIILHHIALQAYGIWTYSFIFTGYLGMSVFGVFNVYIRYIAIYAAKHQTEKINKLASTGIFFVGALCLLFVPILWLSIPWLMQIFNISSDLQPVAKWVLFGTAVTFLIDMTFSVYSSALQSLQKFGVEKLSWMSATLVEAALIVVLLNFGWGLYGLLFAYVLRVILSIFLYALACYRLIPGFSVRISHFDKSLLKLFYRFGGIVQTSGILGVINRSIEKVFAGLFLGPSAAAQYDLGEKFPLMSLMLPYSINAVLLPATADLHAKKMHEKIIDIYVYGSRWVNMLTGLVMGFLAAFAWPIIHVWLGPDLKYQTASLILTVFTFAYQMDVMTGPASAIYRSINQPLRELVYPLLQLLFTLSLGAYVFFYWGASILTINFVVISMMVISVLVYTFQNNRFLKVSQFRYLMFVILPGFVPYFFASLFYFALRMWLEEPQIGRWVLFSRLIICLGLYLLITTPFLYFVLCGKLERSNIRKILRKLIPL